MQCEFKKNITLISENFKIMGLNLLAEITKNATESEIKGLAEIAKSEAIRRKEFFIAQRMERI